MPESRAPFVLRRILRRARGAIAAIAGRLRTVGRDRMPKPRQPVGLPTADTGEVDPRLAETDPAIAAYVGARDPEWFVIDVRAPDNGAETAAPDQRPGTAVPETLVEDSGAAGPVSSPETVASPPAPPRKRPRLGFVRTAASVRPDATGVPPGDDGANADRGAVAGVGSDRADRPASQSEGQIGFRSATAPPTDESRPVRSPHDDERRVTMARSSRVPAEHGTPAGQRIHSPADDRVIPATIRPFPFSASTAPHDQVRPAFPDIADRAASRRPIERAVRAEQFPAQPSWPTRISTPAGRADSVRTETVSEPSRRRAAAPKPPRQSPWPRLIGVDGRGDGASDRARGAEYAWGAVQRDDALIVEQRST